MDQLTKQEFKRQFFIGITLLCFIIAVTFKGDPLSLFQKIVFILLFLMFFSISYSK